MDRLRHLIYRYKCLVEIWKNYLTDEYLVVHELMHKPDFELWTQELGSEFSSRREQLLPQVLDPVHPHDADVQKEFNAFFTDLGRILYQEYRDPTLTPGTYRQDLMKRAGRGWYGEWDEIWPPNEQEAATQVPYGVPDLEKKMAAIQDAANCLGLNQDDQTLGMLLKTNIAGKPEALFETVVRSNYELRCWLQKLRRKDSSIMGEPDEKWARFLGKAVEYVFASTPSATPDQKQTWLDKADLEPIRAYVNFTPE